jgi:hypothetical protein
LQPPHHRGFSLQPRLRGHRSLKHDRPTHDRCSFPRVLAVELTTRSTMRWCVTIVAASCSSASSDASHSPHTISATASPPVIPVMVRVRCCLSKDALSNDAEAPSGRIVA